ncbi:MAG: 5-oxoprolinase subunit PxpB [Rudaea sp.]
MITPSIEALGDSALLIRLGDRIDDALNDAAIDLSDFLRSQKLTGVREVAPAYASVCVRYDITAFASGTNAFDDISERVRRAMADVVGIKRERQTPDPVEIPVCYGGPFGLDLADVAAHCGIGIAEVIDRHASPEYVVAMLGFMPGFPYLRGLDDRLHTPRRATPRTRVPAGSVAIGGAQTGVYPSELPGGWLLIGRTPLTLFDPSRTQPALLLPGQRVRFKPIDAHEFDTERA